MYVSKLWYIQRAIYVGKVVTSSALIFNFRFPHTHHNTSYPALEAPPERPNTFQSIQTEQKSFLESSKIPFLQHASNLEHSKILFMLILIPGDLLAQIQFHKVILVHYALWNYEVIKIINCSPNCWDISLPVGESNFLQIWTWLGKFKYYKKCIPTTISPCWNFHKDGNKTLK